MKISCNTNYLLALALATLGSATGCDDLGGDDDAAVEAEAFGAGQVAERCVGCNIKLNTFAFGKVKGGELDSSGALWGDVKLIQVRLRCTKDSKQMWRYPAACKDGAAMFKLESVYAIDGQLMGKAQGLGFQGADFLKSEWDVDTFDNGVYLERVTHTINAYSYSLNDKLHYYTFDLPNDGTWPEKTIYMPACKESYDPITGVYVGTKSVVYENTTVDTKSGKIGERPNTLYIACVSAAVGKAGAWGFKPWDIGYEDFTTAVRTVRADYCGDGVSWTKPGNALQLADVWGYSGFVNPAGKTEAIWGDSGAQCLGTPRWVGTVKYDDVVCNGAKLKECGDYKLGDFPEATMWSKLP